MLSQTSSVAFRTPKRSSAAAMIIARQDRIPVWSLSNLFIGIIGLGFLFTFFDIFDINVSFIQTCGQIVPGCLPQTASNYIAQPVLLSLLGYVVGALVLGPFADRYGRRDLLVITMLITSLGSLYSAFVGDYPNFLIARTITGIGIGADIALVNTYINELAPNRGRARYTALIFNMSMLGAFLGVWLGLFLTTPATSFPLGLPFAVAGPTFTVGWRVMYGIGALLAICGLLLRFELPESPRWLIARGRLADADLVVSRMEQHALTRLAELPPIAPEIPVRTTVRTAGYSEIFGNPLYLKRTILLLVIWLVAYITIYSWATGATVLLASLGYPAPEAGLIVAIGAGGTILAALISYFCGERLERKVWLPISALLALLGGMTVAFSGDNLVLTCLGALVFFLGSNLWVPVIYTWTTENYPTRARATGFALVDGFGHVGGGVGMSFIVPIAIKLGTFSTFLVLACFLLVAAGLAQFGPATRRKRLDEVSP